MKVWPWHVAVEYVYHNNDKCKTATAKMGDDGTLPGEGDRDLCEECAIRDERERRSYLKQ